MGKLAAGETNMSLPTPAKRRQFEPAHHHQQRVGSHKRRPGEEEQEVGEYQAEEATTRIRTIETGRRTITTNNDDDLSSVNAKIGLFERLSSADEALLRRQQQSGRYHTDLNIDQEELYDSSEQAMYDEHDQLNLVDDEEEDYLVLDTIVEEDDELLLSEADDEEPPAHHRQTNSDLVDRLASSGDGDGDGDRHDKQQPVNCDDAAASSASTVHPKLVRQSAASCASNDPSNVAAATSTTATATTTSQDKNNNHDSPRTESATPESRLARPPGECHHDDDDHDEHDYDEKENNNKFARDRKSVERQQVVEATGEQFYGQSSSSSPGAHNNEQELKKQARLTSENLLVDESRATSVIGQQQQQQQQLTGHETTPLQVVAPNESLAAAAVADLKIKSQVSNSNKMQYQTLLPSTNRLISEHQARQQQALFRALNARQKLLDELGPDERLKQSDLMSASSLHLNKSLSSNHRQWRRTAKKEGTPRGARRRSSSVSTRDTERASDRGVPLSAVDLSSMTDQQVDELLGQLAPASSSSSLASSGGGGGGNSLLNGTRGPMSSSSSSAADSDLSSTSSGSSSSDDLDDIDGQQHMSHMRRARRQRCHSSSTTDSYNNNHNNHNHSNHLQQQVIHHQLVAPSVVGVHEDGGLGDSQVPASKSSLKSHSTRKCREAYKRQRGGRNGRRSDDDEDQDGRDRRNPGDLSINVGGGGANAGGDQPASGVATTITSGQCSLSPQANHVSFGGLSSSTALSSGNTTSGTTTSSQSPTTSDEPSAPASMGSLAPTGTGSRAGGGAGQSVEAILGRMLGALDEVGAQEEQEQLNDLLERGFLHLEQLLNCSLAPNQQQPQPQVVVPAHPTQARSHQDGHLHPTTQAHQLISTQSTTSASQKDSDYGSDTQSNGECFSTATSNASADQAVNAATSVASIQEGGSKTSALSPLAIELSFKLAEALRRLAAQQQQQQASGRQLKASAPQAPPQQQQQTVAMQPEAGGQTPAKARMKSVVMINSPPSACSPASSRPHSSRSDAIGVGGGGVGGNMTPPLPVVSSAAESPRPGSQQSQHRPREFRTRISVNTPTSAAGACDELTSQLETQIVRVVASSPVAQHAGERPSRRSSFRNSSLRRRPSFTGSIASSIREPGGPRPGSPVPRSVLEQQQQVAATTSSTSQQVNNQATTGQCASLARVLSPPMLKSASSLAATSGSGQAPQDASPASPSSKQQRQLQRALILAQKYNYSPAKLAASKLSSKLQLRELIGEQAAGGDSSLATTLPPTVQTTETKLLNGAGGDNGKQQAHQYSLREINGLAQAFAVTGKVQLDISYFAKSGSLTVHLLQCTQLAAVSKRRTTSNPYVKLYLLPDRTKTGKRKSSVKRHQLEPKFDERFTFGPLQLADFDSRILWLSVWHKDRGLSRNEFLGELFLPMSKVRHQLLTSDLSCQSTSAKWYELTDRSDRLESLDSMRQPAAPAAHTNNQSHLLTTKRPPRESGNLSMTLARPSGGNTQAAVQSVQQQQAAEMVAKKLSEFERKAARLTQQSQLALGTPSSGGAASQEHESRLLKTLDRHHKGAAQLPLDSTHSTTATTNGQEPPKTMQVTLGPLELPLPAGTVAPITGQLFVALKFVPETGELLARRASASLEGNLHVLIKEARNIGGFNSAATAKISSNQQQQQQQLPSPFCKCYLLDSSGQRLAKQRTSQLKRTNSPRWDQELVFGGQLKLAHLQAQAIEIQLFNRDSILVSSSEHLGAIRLCKRLKEGVEASTGSCAETDSNSTTTAGSGEHHNQSASLKSFVSSKSSGSNATTGTNGHGGGDEPEEDICSERESRLWSQMLSRPNIWVYGELPLRQLRPLVALSNGATHQQSH